MNCKRLKDKEFLGNTITLGWIWWCKIQLNEILNTDDVITGHWLTKSKKVSLFNLSLNGTRPKHNKIKLPGINQNKIN